MCAKIFFDLDGTLLDSRLRLHTLFCRLVREFDDSAECPDLDAYWRLKRGRVGQTTLLLDHFGFTLSMIAEFRGKWLDQVEDPNLLALDFPFAGVGELLEFLARTNDLYVVTGRQHPDRAQAQVAGFGWDRHLVRILATRQTTKKAALIRENVAGVGAADILVGDTGEDILAARELGIRSFAVLSGFMGREAIESYRPHQVVDSVLDVLF